MLNGSIYQLAADPEVQKLLVKCRPRPKTAQELEWEERAKRRLSGDLKRESRKLRNRIFRRDDAAKAAKVKRQKIANEYKIIYAAIREELDASGMTVRLSRSKLRPAYLCEARDRVIWTAWKKAGMSTTALGRFFRRDHGSILNSIKNHERRLETGEQIDGL